MLLPHCHVEKKNKNVLPFKNAKREISQASAKVRKWLLLLAIINVIITISYIPRTYIKLAYTQL